MAIDKALFDSYPDAPELPASIGEDDSIDEYIISLVRHLATVDFNENDVNLSDRPYRWGISESSEFDANITIPVTIGNLTVENT